MVLDAMDMCPRAFRYVMQAMFQKLTQVSAECRTRNLAEPSDDKPLPNASFLDLGGRAHARFLVRRR